MDDFDLGKDNLTESFLEEIKELKSTISELSAQNSKMKDLIMDHGLDSEIDLDCTSVEEQLCVNGINYIAQLVKEQDFTDKDIKSFDTLLKSLRSIRGKKDSLIKPTSKKSTADILKLVEGYNNANK